MSESVAIDYSTRHESFERWFQSPLGRALLADQRRFLDAELQNLTGARQLQVGVSHRLPLATGTDFSQRIIATPRWFPNMPDGVAICDADELAFPGDSMDLVVMHHTADFSPCPHQVIREAARVLRGEGTMVLIGFNPLSLWGVRKLIARSNEGPWGGRFLLRGRMEDWLRLLGFEVEESVTRFFRVPLQRGARKVVSRVDNRLSGNRFLPVGGYYCILAKKRVHARLPRRPVWRQSKVIAMPGTRAVGASRGCSRNDSPVNKL
ncbi:class I SAM-dependent methyltransferase [Marinobacter sp. F3R08]|uniref:class I SAM-dependent methyltransferase n=1 Tax=Marinobacter sp. F3R08 TaxID=2841559 RepID=UPI001C089026|nr:methyltransferase domain-containing protein [Marinobacter sp. F3R08]MBU2955709.1 class I SAM-dependent methyltransferase [Marinobacter sp. F3R08]